MTVENTVWYFFQTDAMGGNVTIDITNTVCNPLPEVFKWIFFRLLEILAIPLIT